MKSICRKSYVSEDQFFESALLVRMKMLSAKIWRQHKIILTSRAYGATKVRLTVAAKLKSAVLLLQDGVNRCISNSPYV